jgi:predicted peptidase
MYLSLILFLLGGEVPMAAFEPTPGDHALSFTASYDNSSEPYRLFIPEQARNKKPLPLLVVLHGKGADQNTWFDYTPVRKFAGERGYVVLAPRARGDYFYRGAAEQDVLDTIRIVQHMVPIDPDRIYLMGHSMGGWGCFWIALRNPDLFAAICPMSGFSPLELMSNARHLSPLMIHDTDDPIVPVENFRSTAEKLASLGISFRYKEEQGYEHNSKMIGDNFPALFDWIIF